MKTSALILLLTHLLASSIAWAQSKDEEVKTVFDAYSFGNHEYARDKARLLIDQGGLTADQLVQLHTLAGLAALNLGQQKEAERHFLARLLIRPDEELDPALVSSDVQKLFARIRQSHQTEVDAARQRLEAEERQRQEEAGLAANAGAGRGNVATLTERSLERVESRSFAVNFIPFGAGQFQQRRYGRGILFAVGQGLLAGASLLSYFSHQALFTTETLTVHDLQDGPQELTKRGIPQERMKEAQAWKWVNRISTVGFYGAYLAGTVDAVMHHQPQVVTSTQVDPPSSPSAASPAPFLFPTSGGLGAGFTLDF